MPLQPSSAFDTNPAEADPTEPSPSRPSPADHSPSRAAGETRFALQLFAVNALIRAAIVAAYFTVAGGTWKAYLGVSDAGSFIGLAHRLAGTLSAHQLSFYASRVFPGWPLMLAAFYKVGFPEVTALALSILAASALPWAFYRLTQRKDLAWAISFLPPVWFVSSLHPMAEPVYLLLALLAILAWRAKHHAWAGIAFGYLCAVKPFGLFVALPAVWVGVRDAEAGQRWKVASKLLLPPVVIGLAFAGLNWAIFGDIVHQLHVYAAPLKELNLPPPIASHLGNSSGHWGPPFVALIDTPFIVTVPAWKLVYVYAHAVLLVAALIHSALFLTSTPRSDALSRLMRGWLCLNGVAILCTGPYWGFYAFDRYFLWAWPAMLYLYRDLLKDRRILLWTASAASVMLAIATLFRRV